MIALLAVVLLAATAVTAAGAEETGLLPYRVVGDAIPAPLGGRPGDPARGRAIVISRRLGLCLLCHSGPFPEERFQGNLAPDLRSAARLSEAEIRLRLVDPARVNPQTIMPAYYRAEGLTRVAPSLRGKTILSAEQIEDVIAYLVTLK